MGDRFCFSPCGSFLAHLNSGKLRIWETDTNTLKQEFIPGTHLSSPCSSLTWVPVANYHEKVKKKKRRSSQANLIYNLLALGTDSGQIFFYSIAQGDIILTLSGHNRSITSLAALPGTDLYSSSAKVIIQWDIADKKLKSKWKCEELGSINKLLITEDNELLLAAISPIIVCWNVKNRTIVHRFKGHASSVVDMSVCFTPTGEKYLFSSAEQDRIINLWNFTKLDSSKPVVKFSLPDVISSLSSHVDSKEIIKVSTVTKGGSLHVYSHHLDRHSSKPISPSNTILVCSEDSKQGSKSELIPIVNEKMFGNELKIAYGFSPFICCESINTNFTDSELFLVRKNPRLSKVSKEESIKKVKSSEPGNNIEYLSSAAVNGSLKRDIDTMDSEEKETISSLLENMNLSSTNEQTGDSLTHLLIQGLNSQDKNILKTVLFTQNENKIKSTVDRLPIQAVLPLLKIVSNLIQGKTWMCQIGIMWIHAILRTHISQLLADENSTAIIAPLLGIIERRLTCLGPLRELEGRISLLLDQTSCSTTHPIIDSQPLLIYQDNDSSSNSNCLLEDHDVDISEKGPEDEEEWINGLLNEKDDSDESEAEDDDSSINKDDESDDKEEMDTN